MLSKIARAVYRKRVDLFLVMCIDAIYFFSYFQRVAVPGTVFNELQHDLHASSSDVTLMGSTYLYSYAGMQIISGMMIDKFGAMRMAIIGGFVLSLSSILFPMSHSLAIMYTARVLVGAGASLIYLCVVKIVDISFSDKTYPKVLSISQSFGFCGALVATFPFERCVAAMGWRPALLTAALASTFIVILAAIFNRGSIASDAKAEVASPLPALKMIVTNPLMYPPLITAAMLQASPFIMQAIIGKKLLEDCCGLSSATASTFTLAATLSAAVGGIIGGFIPSMMGHRRKPLLLLVSIFSVIAPAYMYFGLKMGSAASVLMPCYVLFGAVMSAASVINSSIKELNPPETAATTIGVSNCAVWLNVSIASSICGFVMDRFRSQAVVTKTAIQYPVEAYLTIFMGLFVIGVLTVICASLIKETRGKNRWQA